MNVNLIFIDWSIEIHILFICVGCVCNILINSSAERSMFVIEWYVLQQFILCFYGITLPRQNYS